MEQEILTSALSTKANAIQKQFTLNTEVADLKLIDKNLKDESTKADSLTRYFIRKCDNCKNKPLLSNTPITKIPLLSLEGFYSPKEVKYIKSVKRGNEER